MGLIFDIKRGSIKDGPGFRTSVFLKGCPLRCSWCHNPESQSPMIQRAVTTGEVCGREMSVDEVMSEVLEDKMFYGEDGGVTFTGGEPTAQPDFLVALGAAARAADIRVAVDTCGYAPWPVFERLVPVVDLFLYDLKCMDAARHRDLTGVDNALILDNLRRLDRAGSRIWIRCPVVPTLNDSESDCRSIRHFLDSLSHVEKMEICPYHAIGLEKYARFGMTAAYAGTEPPSEDTLKCWSAGARDFQHQIP